MEKYSINGNGSSEQLLNYETPFADVSSNQEEPFEGMYTENFQSNILSELETPFSKTFDAAASTVSSPANEEFAMLLAELNDQEFTNTLYELANELEETWKSKISSETAMGERYEPFATQQAAEYFAPIYRETEKMIDRVSEFFSGNNLADHSDAEIEAFFSQLEFEHSGFSPAQEQFLGGVFKKVASVVKKGVDIAKKGISAVGKVLPINIILNKIKALINPLLNRVLKFAIGKLPKNLQSHAQVLAKKFLKLETPAMQEPSGTNVFASGELEAIQTELDTQMAQLVFASDETDADSYLMEYESAFETIERREQYESGGMAIPSLDVARQQFIDELKALPEGASPAPAIEKFLPAAILALQPAIKVAISIIGRQRVINFLASLLAKLVGRYVPATVARPLAASIIDVGMSAIGFETQERDKPDVAYEAIVDTIQETIQNMGDLNEAVLNDNEALTMQLLEAFESAAANNFPPKYIREALRPSAKPGVWVLKPRNGSRHLYKKFTHVFSVTIDPKTAATVTSFRGTPLANFLRDKYGLDVTRPISAKVHLYEAIPGTWLSRISKNENLPGLNSGQPHAWVQLHPLTSQAATLLLNEPGLGKDVSQAFSTSRHKIAVGQRFYFLEISGARLRIPPVNRSKQNDKPSGGLPVPPKPSRSSDIQGVINFIKSEIRFNYYFSEEDAKSIVEKLNRNDFIGAALNLRRSVRDVLHGILLKNVGNKVKIIHEAVPEMYLEHYEEEQEQFAPLAALGRAVGGLALNAGKGVITKVIEKLIEKLSDLAYQALLNYFKARAAEFKQAQAQPQDGVTIKIIWINIPGMSTIRAMINAIRGNASVGNLTDLVLPSIPTPDIKVMAAKHFD